MVFQFPARGIRQFPNEGEDIPSYRVQNFRIDGVGGIGGLMKVRVDTAADDSDSRYSSFFEGHVIAAGKESVHVKLVG